VKRLTSLSGHMHDFSHNLVRFNLASFITIHCKFAFRSAPFQFTT